MSEVWLPVGGRNVITVRLESNNVSGRDMGGQLALYLPLQLQLLPAGQQKDVQYQLVRLVGKLQCQPLGEFASFDVGPLAEAPNLEPFFRQQEAFVLLDRQQISRFEEVRAGKVTWMKPESMMERLCVLSRASAADADSRRKSRIAGVQNHLFTL